MQSGNEPTQSCGYFAFAKKARKQLPADAPGIVFVKIPSRWANDRALLSVEDFIQNEFLRGTARVVSVKLYISEVRAENNRLSHTHAFKEITNQRSRFYCDQNWDLFREDFELRGWNDMPEKWRRLLFQ